MTTHKDELDKILDVQFGISLRENGFSEGAIEQLKMNAITAITELFERRQQTLCNACKLKNFKG